MFERIKLFQPVSDRQPDQLRQMDGLCIPAQFADIRHWLDVAVARLSQMQVSLC